MVLRRAVACLLLVLLARPPFLRAQAAPKLVSIFPLGAQRGKAVDLEVRGSGLEGVSAVWLGPGSKLDSAQSSSDSKAKIRRTKSTDGLEAHVQAVEGGSRVTVRLTIAADARAGFHSLSLISPHGLSASIPFWVGTHPVIQESAKSHNTPQTAEAMKLPAAVNGRITASGQLAYYSFEVASAQTLAFEVVSLHGAGFDPQFALYEAGGSYLDAKRSKRLLFHEEITQGGMPASRRVTHSFKKPGRYCVNVGNPFAQGGKDSSYLLQVAPAPSDRKDDGDDALSWARRRVQEIRSRTTAAPALKPALVSETEPNDQPAQAKAFEVPAVLAGTIGRPGDVDRFRFKAKAGQKLAFEIRTPRAAPPHFNLRVDVLNAKGTAVLTNLQVKDGKVGLDAAKVIGVSSAVAGKLDEDGEYTVRVRDVTTIRGRADHVYQVLVRPQIPHVGDIRLRPDGPVNLTPGARRRLTLQATREEGYAGTRAFSVEGLPPGVKAFVGESGTAIELVADASARPGTMPEVLRILCLPLEEDKSGRAFLVAEVPVMIIKK